MRLRGIRRDIFFRDLSHLRAFVQNDFLVIRACCVCYA
jgi:hypothetical protein